MGENCPAANCDKPDVAADKAVKRVFNIIGVDVDDPVQVENFRRGLRFGEELLETSNTIKRASVWSVVSLMATALVYLIWGKISGGP